MPERTKRLAELKEERMKPTDQNTKQETQEEARSTREREARNSKGELSLSPIMVPQPWSSSVGGGRGGMERESTRVPSCP
jgi:hypothetical protein